MGGGGGEREIIYLSLHSHHQNDSCIRQSLRARIDQNLQAYRQSPRAKNDQRIARVCRGLDSPHEQHKGNTRTITKLSE